MLATALTGYLANVDWHLPFLVYTLPGISLALSLFLRRQPSDPEPAQSIQLRYKRIDTRKLVGLMLFYFFITYAVLAIVYYAAFLVEACKIRSSFSGVLISLFFLAIMLPGLFIDRIIRRLKADVNLVSLLAVALGLLCFGIFRSGWLLAVGALLAGIGYGVMQPVIYDKAGNHRSAPRRDVRPVVRHGHELSRRDGLPLPDRSLPLSVPYARRPLPLHFQCRIGLSACRRHVAATREFHPRARCGLLQKWIADLKIGRKGLFLRRKVA